MRVNLKGRYIPSNRYKVEQLIGNVKNWFTDRFNTKDFSIAERLVIVNFLLYNLYVLVELYFLMFRIYIIYCLFFKAVGFFKQPQLLYRFST